MTAMSCTSGSTSEPANARRNGGRFTRAEAREERAKARALVKPGINLSHHRQLDRIKCGRHETIAAFRLMWLTLCRPSEAAEARWAEFDLDAALWRIPAERMKKR